MGSSDSKPVLPKPEPMVDPDALKEPIFTQPFYTDVSNLTLKSSDEYTSSTKFKLPLSDELIKMELLRSIGMECSKKCFSYNNQNNENMTNGEMLCHNRCVNKFI